MLEKELKFEGNICFGSVLEIYKQLISLGNETLNAFGFTAKNNELNLIFDIDEKYEHKDFSVSINKDKKSLICLVEGFHSKIRGAFVQSNCTYKDPLLRSLIGEDGYQEYGSWNIMDFVNVQIDELETYKQSISLLPANVDLYIPIPLIKNRVICFNRTDKNYDIRLEANTNDDLKYLENKFFEIVNKN